MKPSVPRIQRASGLVARRSVPLRPMDQAIEIATQVGPVLMLAGYLTKDYFDRRPIRVRPGERVVVRDNKGHPYWFEGPPGP